MSCNASGSSNDRSCTSYQYPENGPGQYTLPMQMAKVNHDNVAFDQKAWQNARQDGCMLLPGCPPTKFGACGLPQWPPNKESYIYPEMELEPQEILGSRYTTQEEKDILCGKASEKPLCCFKSHRDMLNETTTEQQDVLAPEYPDYPQMQITNQDYLNDVPTQRPELIIASNSRFAGGKTSPSDPMFADRGKYYTNIEQPTTQNFYRTSGESYVNSGNGNKVTRSSYTEKLMLYIVNSCKGCLHDLEHWESLPGNTTLDKLEYALTRDGRSEYLSVLVGGLLVLYLFLTLVLK